MKKIVSTILVFVTMFSFMTNSVQATDWVYNGGAKFSSSKNGWKCYLSQIGSRGIYGQYVVTNSHVPLAKGKRYILEFDLLSKDIDKWIFIKIGTRVDSEIDFGKWIDCKKGKKTHVCIPFTAINEDSLVFIAFGGDYGHGGYESDSYKYRTSLSLDGRLDPYGDRLYKMSTTIICSNYSFKPESQTKIKLNKKTIKMKIKKQTTLSLKNATSKVKWKNTNKKVISFKKKGKNKITIKGLKKGKTTITATYKSKKYKCKVIVK